MDFVPPLDAWPALLAPVEEVEKVEKVEAIEADEPRRLRGSAD